MLCTAVLQAGPDRRQTTFEDAGTSVACESKLPCQTATFRVRLYLTSAATPRATSPAEDEQISPAAN